MVSYQDLMRALSIIKPTHSLVLTDCVGKFGPNHAQIFESLTIGYLRVEEAINVELLDFLKELKVPRKVALGYLCGMDADITNSNHEIVTYKDLFAERWEPILMTNYYERQSIAPRKKTSLTNLHRNETFGNIEDNYSVELFLTLEFLPIALPRFLSLK